MSRRPEGTDGSDFNFREVIEDRYKRMAVHMSATLLLHQLQTLAVVLKAAWSALPLLTEGRLLDAYGPAILGVCVVGNILFYAGKPRGRCVLPLMKFAAICVMFTLALVVISLWKYHLVDPATSRIPRRVYKYYKDEGKLTSAHWLNTLTVLETVMDVFQLGTVGLCFYTLNSWVKDAMEALKEREERSAAVAPAIKPPAGRVAGKKRM